MNINQYFALDVTIICHKHNRVWYFVLYYSFRINKYGIQIRVKIDLQLKWTSQTFCNNTILAGNIYYS